MLQQRRLRCYQLAALLLSFFTANFLVYQNKLAILPLGLFLSAGVLNWFLQHQSFIFWGILFSTPFNDHLSLKLGPLNLRSYTFFIFVGLLSLLLKLYHKSVEVSLNIGKKILPIFFPLIALALSKILTVFLLDSYPVGMTKKFILKYVIIQLLLYQLAFVTAVSVITIERFYQAIKALLYMANLIFIIAILQLVLSNVAGFHYVHHRDVIFFGRPYSVFREPDVLASFVAAIFMMAIPLYHSKKDYGISKKFLLVTLGLHALLLLILLVRAAWLATMCAFGFFIACLLFLKYLGEAGKIVKKVLFILLGSTLLLIVFAPALAGKIAARFGSIVDTKGQQESAKAYRKLELIAMFEQTIGKGLKGEAVGSMFFGYGDFSWSYWAPLLLGKDYDQDAEKNAGSEGVLIHPGFNFVLSILNDNGLIGIFLYLLFWYVLFKHFWNKLKDPKVIDKHLLLTAYLPIMVMILCFIFSYDPITPFLWMLVGLYLGASYHLESDTSS